MVPRQRARTPGDQRGSTPWTASVTTGCWACSSSWSWSSGSSPSHDLFTRASWLNISQYAVEFLLLAIGQTFVIITGGIDLSDGAVLGFTGMVSGVVMQGLLNAHANVTLTTVAGFATALALGALIGFVNGYLITRLKLPPFIVTLGSLTAIGAGATPLINGGNEVINLPLPDRHHRPDPDRRLDLRPRPGGSGELRGHGPGPAPHPFRVAHLLHRQQRHGSATRSASRSTTTS